ncbi:CehA/McbA family metallohydrolase [Nonomuraea sp. B12E4]|uniref:CehA/McbA family metallohydrolase n=1 Tax=Nonomuraea sp. B12E4 TaxID=3153564 RepID=UPI00325F45E1
MELSRRHFVTVAGGAAVAAGGVAATPALADAKTPQGQWLAGDTHVHNDHSADGSLPRQQSKQTLPGNLPVADQIGEAERTGLDFLPLTDHRTYDQHWDPQWQSSKLLLVPGEEANGSPHAIVLGAVDTVVDGANPPGSPAFRHVQQSIWDAHAQDAIWSTAHPDDGEYTPEDGPNDNASVQGMNTVEVWNVASDPDAQIDYAENRWNAGFRFGAVAASDCHFRELWGTAGPGQPTTWVFAAERSVRGILDGLRAGRTSVSYRRTGPFATVEADLDGDGRYEALGGDEVVLRHARLPKKASLRVRVRQAAGARVLVYASPGRSAGPVATYTAGSDDETYHLPVSLKGAHTWYRVEVRAPGDLSGRDADPNLPDQLRGATSPVFISVGSPAEPAPEIALPPGQHGGDRASLAIGGTGRFTGFADVAVNGNGDGNGDRNGDGGSSSGGDGDKGEGGRENTVHVVAEVHDGSRTSVVYRRLDRPHVVTLSGDSPTARFPQVAASGDDVWVVWQDELGREQPHRPVILLRHSRDGGRSFEPAVRLSSGSGRAVHPGIALLEPRRPVVVWADNARGPFDVYAQVVGVDRAPVNLSSAGKDVSVGTPQDARSPRFPASLFPSVAAGEAGQAIVTWQDNRFDPDPLWTGHTPAPGEQPGGTDPDNWQILASVRGGGEEAAWTEPVQVSAATDAADRHPSVAADGEGGFVAIWETRPLRSSGANLALRAARSADGGRTWSPPEQVALSPDAMSQRPRLSQDPDKTVRAVWYDSRSADWRWKVFTSRRESTGWTAAEQLTTPGNNTWPATDRGVVVFTTDRSATRTQRDVTQEVHLLRTR